MEINHGWRYDNKSKFMKMTKQNRILLIVFGLIVSLLLSLEWFMYTNSKIVCGKIISQKRQSRGGYSVYYDYLYNGKKMKSAIETTYLKDITLDSLKKIDCIKIEVSNYSTFFNRIVDKRVLAE